MYDQYFAGCVLTSSSDYDVTNDHWTFRNTEQQNQDRAIILSKQYTPSFSYSNKKEVNGIIYFGQVHICFSLEKYKMTFSFAELEYICYCICAHWKKTQC